MAIIAEFFTDEVHLEAKSEAEGRPIYETREFVRIIIPGDRTSELVCEVSASHRDRWHEEYARFKRGLFGQDQIAGTPLREWPAIPRSQAKELAGLNIYTVEQIADLSDTQKQMLGMGAHELVAQAKAYLDKAKDSSASQALAATNERLSREIEDLRRQMRELGELAQSRVEPDVAKRGPGRPPK